jgi:peptidoglycan-associated lipoprotein
MNRRSLIALLLGLTVAISACHKNPPPGTAPATNPGMTAPPPASTPPPSSPSNVGNGNMGNGGGNVDANAAGRVASMSDRIHFEYNVSDLKPEDIARLDTKAALMKQFPLLKIRITGHADERGSDQYNIALGMRRAAAAKEYLVKVGIDGGRIETASLGREVPIDPASNEAAWAQNRRDEFDIVAGSQSLRAP